jgi:predicted nuclease of restriction endonuclease-like (RecB) superfamily
LARVENAPARSWYQQEAIQRHWSVRALDRQITHQMKKKPLRIVPEAQTGYALAHSSLKSRDDDSFLKNGHFERWQWVKTTLRRHWD